MILSALRALIPCERLVVIDKLPSSDDGVSLASLIPAPDTKVLQITPYEAIDFEYAAAHPRSCLVNSYMIRKALIRKHYLSATVELWVAKHPDSVLARHVKRSEAFEVDYAEFLDDALVEAFDLRASLERNEGVDPHDGDSVQDDHAGDPGEAGSSNQHPPETAAAAGSESAGAGREGRGGLLPRRPAEREWWILKPGMSDRGQGIKLFSTMAELQDIFDTWEAEQPDSEADDDDDHDAGDDNDAAQTMSHGADTAMPSHNADNEGGGRDYITTSHLRHFVAQPYIHPPLLLLGDGRKFHIRTYVLCVGSLQVYVFRPMLALFAAKPYRPPWEDDDLSAHLTNTCLQQQQQGGGEDEGGAKEGSVRRFWDLDDAELLAADITPLPGSSSSSSSSSGHDGNGNNNNHNVTKEGVFAQVCHVTGELFEAAARGSVVHFQPLGHAFEVFGLDFLVDAAGAAWLLEVNAFPDFKQTGDALRDVVAEFWAATLRLAVGPFAGLPAGSEDGESSSSGGGGSSSMVLVREVDLGRRSEKAWAREGSTGQFSW